MKKFESSTRESQARSRIYCFLAAGFSYPDAQSYQRLLGNEYFLEVDKRLKDLGASQVEPLSEPVAPSLAELQEEYGRLFSANSPCSPYETEYTSCHIFAKTQTLADISGFYRAFGLDTSSEQKERVDFIGTQLEFMGLLCFKMGHASDNQNEDNFAVCLDAQKKFLGDHLGRWGELFCQRLTTQTENVYYKRLSSLLLSFLDCEKQYLDVTPEEINPLQSSKPSRSFQPESDCSACL